MVAAAKMRKAQDNMHKARPYAAKLRETISSLAAHTDHEQHPLLAIREAHKIGLICVTSDRGLAGGFNANICRRTMSLIDEHKGHQIELITLGKKGHDFFNKRGVPIHKFWPGVFQELEFSQAAAIGAVLANEYIHGAFDRFYVVFNEFKNVVQQNTVVEQLLPIEPLPEMTNWSPVEYIFEPDATRIIESILPLSLNIEIWQVMLESYASEQAARMSSMDNATKNANELVESLTLQFNKARQAAITGEILEIVSGAEGLR